MEGKDGLKAGDCVSEVWTKDRETFFKDQQNNGKGHLPLGLFYRPHENNFNSLLCWGQTRQPKHYSYTPGEVYSLS